MKKIVDRMIELIQENQRTLEQLKKEDDEVYKVDFESSKLIEFLRRYEDRKIEVQEEKHILVSHYGNPYMTLLLCMEALQCHVQVTIEIEEIAYGLNQAIVKMANLVLEECGIARRIQFCYQLTNAEIEKMDVAKIVCLGNSNTYEIFRNLPNKKVEYVPFFNVVVYFDDSEYEELVRNIVEYTERNFYEIEIFHETDDFEEVIYEMAEGQERYCAVILSKNVEKQAKFREQVKAPIICVNENPFKKFEWEIPKEVFG